ncbi:MAPK-activated protein kinase Srk1 [Conglomerata obtusa]
MKKTILYSLFILLCKLYVPNSLVPIVSFLNKRVSECLVYEERTKQNKIFSKIFAERVRPIKMTNSSAVFELNKTNCIIKRVFRHRKSGRNESMIAVEMNHPNIITSYLAFEEIYNKKRIGWIISEYLDVTVSMRNLKCENEIRKMCRDVCKGLVYLHSKDVAHLDMKLGNVMGKFENTSRRTENTFIENLIKEVQEEQNIRIYNKQNQEENLKLIQETYDLWMAKQLERHFIGKCTCPKIVCVYTSKNDLINEKTNNLYEESGVYRIIQNSTQKENTVLNETCNYSNKTNDTKICNDICEISSLFGEMKSQSDFLNKFSSTLNLSLYLSKNCDLLFRAKTDKNEDEKENYIKKNEITYKIIDFGFSRIIKGDEVLDMKYKYYGTFPYSPPEIYFDALYSKKADIWCLGAMAYFLTSNNRLFYYKNGDRNIIEYEKFLQGKSKFHFGSISQDMKDFISKCMQIDFKKRPNAAELLNHPFIVNIID